MNERSRRRWRRPLPTILAVLALLAALPLEARAASPLPTPTPSVARWAALAGSLPTGLGLAKRVGVVPNAQPIGVAVSLRMRDEAGLTRFIQEVSDPSSPSYRRFLTTAQFRSRFAPTAAVQSQVRGWLRSRGLRVTGTSANGLQISATGSAAAMRRAFGTPLYTFKRGGTTFRANASALRLPGPVAPRIVSVSGLDSRPVVQPQSHIGSGTSNTPTGYGPSDLERLYDTAPLIAGGVNGSGQTIAIASFADFNNAVVATYTSQYGLAPSISRVKISAGGRKGAPLGVKNGEDEAEMDVELVAASAPGASILVYEGPNTSAGSVALYNRIASDNRAGVVSNSWGGPEASMTRSDLRAVDQALREMAAQGQAFFAASGDSGAYDAAGILTNGETTLAVDFPASDPYATGVGGTQLEGTGDAYVGEMAWTESGTSGPAGSGGGLSDVYSRPSWQTGPGVQNSYSNGRRQVPDVAANASPRSGYAVYAAISSLGAAWAPVGGTSAAAPVWAGFAALVNGALGQRVGFMNPVLYTLGQNASTFAAPPFHDVTSGTNLYYPATTGWDYATGWGSFDGVAFVAALKSLGSAALAPTTTPTPTVTPTTLTITRVLLFHRVNGKLKRTSTLKVGETGTMIIQYASSGSTVVPRGTIVVRQGGKAVKSLTLTATAYGGKPALKGSVRFTKGQRTGTLLAYVKLALGSVSAVFDRTFTVVKRP